MDNFWAPDNGITNPNDRCQTIKSKIVRNEPIEPALYHDLDRNVESPECLYLLTFWKITDMLPNIETDKQLISDLLYAEKAGVIQARDTLSAMHKLKLLELPQNHPSRDYERLDILSAETSTNSKLAIQAREEGNYSGERAALLVMAHKGQLVAAHELAYLAYREAGAVTPEAIYWYRVSLFLGEPRAAQSLSAFFLRALAANKSIEAPEGVLAGSTLFDAGLNYMADSATVMGGYPKSVVKQLQELKSNGLTGENLSQDAVTYLTNVQPTGQLLSLDHFKLSIEPSGINMNVYAQGMTIDSQDFPRINITLSEREFASTDVYVSAPGWEVWRVGKSVEIAAQGQFQGLGFTGDLTACTNWFDLSACDERLSAQIDLSELDTEKEGLFLLRLVSGTNAPYAPVPILKPVNASEAKRSVGLIYPDYTWQAYNVTYGGSLYISDRSNKQHAVSLERPLNERAFMAHHNYRATLAVAREYARLGISVAHIAQSNASLSTDNLSGFNTIAIVGHDEYWDPSYETFLRSYAENGGNLLFLSANSGWWKIDRVGNIIGVNKAVDNGVIDLESTDSFNVGLNMPETGLKMLMDGSMRIETLTGSTYETGGYAVRYAVPYDEQEKYNLSDEIYFGSGGLFVMSPDHKLFPIWTWKPARLYVHPTLSLTGKLMVFP